MAKAKKTAAPAAGAESLQAATQVLATTLAAALSKPAIELKVGIVNISDNTIGVKSPFKDEVDLDLHGDTLPRNENPSRFAVISLAWWQQLRKSKLMERGEIMRDDSVLGTNYTAAPADAPQDIPAAWVMNAVEDPIVWVANFKGDDDALRLALGRMTNETSLRRVRRVVDMKLKELERSFGVDPQRAKKALQALPSTYQMMDQFITMKLERPDEE